MGKRKKKGVAKSKGVAMEAVDFVDLFCTGRKMVGGDKGPSGVQCRD